MERQWTDRRRTDHGQDRPFLSSRICSRLKISTILRFRDDANISYNSQYPHSEQDTHTKHQVERAFDVTASEEHLNMNLPDWRTMAAGQRPASWLSHRFGWQTTACQIASFTRSHVHACRRKGQRDGRKRRLQDLQDSQGSLASQIFPLSVGTHIRIEDPVCAPPSCPFCERAHTRIQLTPKNINKSKD